MREYADDRDAQSPDGCTGGEQCGSRCVHFQEPNLLELDGHAKELLEVSRQVEFDFMSRVGLYRKQPGNIGNVHWHSSYPGKLVGREQGGCQAIVVSIEIAHARNQTMGSDSARNACVNEIVRMRNVPSLQSDAHNWEKKWQNVLIEMNLEVGTWPSAIMCCREREG